MSALSVCRDVTSIYKIFVVFCVVLLVHERYSFSICVCSIHRAPSCFAPQGPFGLNAPCLFMLSVLISSAVLAALYMCVHKLCVVPVTSPRPYKHALNLRDVRGRVGGAQSDRPTYFCHSRPHLCSQ